MNHLPDLHNTSQIYNFYPYQDVNTKDYCWLPVFMARKDGRCNLSFCQSASALSATKLGNQAFNLQNFPQKPNWYLFNESVLINWQPTLSVLHSGGNNFAEF